MITADRVAIAFFDCLDKGAIKLFRDWIALHPHTSRWLIGADFALRDTKRAGDCFAFTLFPYDAWPDDIVRDIKANLPRDLKDLKTLDERSVKWLRDPRRFHFVIPVNRDRVVFTNGVPGDTNTNSQGEYAG